jgi:hypothetical protein
MGVVEAQDAHDAAMGILEGDIPSGGLGRFSPAVMWGINSEVGNPTISQLSALNATDAQGYAINNPQPTAASLTASHALANLNPNFADAFFTAASFLPGVGALATIAGAIEGRGLINQVENQLDIDLSLPDIFGNISDTVTGAMSDLATALGGDQDMAFGDPSDIEGLGPEPDAPEPQLEASRERARAVTEAIDEVDEIDTFLDPNVTGGATPLVDIPAATSTVSVLGYDTSLGTDSGLRPGSFRRSRITTPSSRAFNMANLYRPTLSSGISL